MVVLTDGFYFYRNVLPLFNARSSYLRAGDLANTFKCLDSKKILVILTLGDLANTYRSARIKVLVILTQLILDMGTGTILSLQFV